MPGVGKVRYSERFGEIVRELLQKHGLSYAQATIRTDGEVNRSYWSSLTGGLVPSREKMLSIARAFPEDAALVREAFEACGYAPPDALAELQQHNEDIERIARLRNIEPRRVLQVLIEEELRRLEAASDKQSAI